jgi:hypothetical protein
MPNLSRCFVIRRYPCLTRRNGTIRLQEPCKPVGHHWVLRRRFTGLLSVEAESTPVGHDLAHGTAPEGGVGIGRETRKACPMPFCPPRRNRAHLDSMQILWNLPDCAQVAAVRPVLQNTAITSMNALHTALQNLITVAEVGRSVGRSASLSRCQAPIWDPPSISLNCSRGYVDVRRPPLLLDLGSAIVLGSESRGTRDRISVSQI